MKKFYEVKKCLYNKSEILYTEHIGYKLLDKIPETRDEYNITCKNIPGKCNIKYRFFSMKPFVTFFSWNSGTNVKININEEMFIREVYTPVELTLRDIIDNVNSEDAIEYFKIKFGV